MIRFMLSNINEILDLLIKSGIVIGIIISIYFFCRISSLSSRSEKINEKFEKDRNSLRGQGRGIPEAIINDQTKELEKRRNEKIAPLERERQRLISRMLFFK